MENNEYNYNEFIGILATDEEIHTSLGDRSKDSVFINSQNDIQYQVKALSDNAPTRFFTGYINSINENSDLNLDDSYSFDENYLRISAFREKMSNYVFVFTTRSVLSGKGDGKKYYKINKTDLIARPAPIKDNDMFITVPVFSPKELINEWEFKTGARLQHSYSSYDEFIDCIKKGEPIGRVSHFDNTDCPRFIVWYDENYDGSADGKFCAIGPFASVQFTGFGSYILHFDKLYEIDLTVFEDYMIFPMKINPSVIHVVENVYDTITSKFVSLDGVSLISSKGAEIAESERVSDSSNPIEEVSVIDIDPTIKNDVTLLKTFNRLCEENNLFYAPKDLNNIHTAIKTGNLVILSGMSGTGKSAVVDMYARALGLRFEDDDDRVLIIPVRPSWNDDSDLLGYVDLIHMVYRASDTGFVKLLVEASKEENKKNLYFVCFDEMNLARVEHYFSQFLSILEKPVGKRKLRLYDEQYRGRLYNSSEYPDVIDLKDNIRFIGTVNIDESTYHFADKVLDRSNVISFQVLPFNSWTKHPYTSKAIQEWSYDEYRAIAKMEEKTAPSQLKEFLWNFHQILQNTSLGLGIGPRVVKSIELYLSNLPSNADDFTISLSEGIDIQVKQRILTKICGSAEQFSQLFEDDTSSIICVFDKYYDLSDFHESRQAVEQKKKELRVYGYCL